MNYQLFSVVISYIFYSLANFLKECGIFGHIFPYLSGECPK